MGHLDRGAAAEVRPPGVLSHDDEASVDGQVADRDVVPPAGPAADDMQNEHGVVHHRVQP
jgi:hypothetical protein